MILIIGYVEEHSVQDVLKIIEHSGQEAIVVGHDNLETVIQSLKISNDSISLVLARGERVIGLNDIKTVWYRKSGIDKTYEVEGLDKDSILSNRVNFHLKREISGFKNAVYEFLLLHCRSLGHPQKNDINKIYSLIQAKSSGLKIPNTLVSCSFSNLRQFVETPGNYITKSIQDSLMAVDNGNVYSLYTNRITMKDIEEVYRESIFPSYLQCEIEKDFEVRTFYLNGVCYSMAIFSQADKKTAIDYRDYNWKKMNRMTPFNLPAEIEEKIKQFMHSVGLNTGSLDIIRTKNKEYIFLEVNPVGQFGFVSNHCNYYLEEKVANYLMSS